ncbi:MAG: ABC transporter ATP-binding protein [Acidilobaceae archaeon]|nr:ABC transporter ATP-binding protein [Acidilobaceae archaeon]MCX8165923.1 ABC transporter ATP-binding protein [Acidilobaceae archaeon]MDW7974566.1 ABC transporter ATP-binding protein [Sulfolobales archaeon]
MTAVIGRGLVKSYGRVRALDGLDIRIEYNEIYGLIGPNGSGKSTFIKSLLGIVKLDKGELFALGRRAPSKQLLRDVGYMPQEPALYSNMSVEDNLVFFGKLYGVPRLREAVEEIISLLRLEEKRKELVESLSGGMQRRVSLGVALLHKPKLLLLDEPTVGIDPLLRAELWDYLRRATKEMEATILITTHYMDEARRCDRIGFIMNGRMLSEGRPEELARKVGTEDLEEAYVRYVRGGK